MVKFSCSNYQRCFNKPYFRIQCFILKPIPANFTFSRTFSLLITQDIRNFILDSPLTLLPSYALYICHEFRNISDCKAFLRPLSPFPTLLSFNFLPSSLLLPSSISFPSPSPFPSPPRVLLVLVNHPEAEAWS